jgi:hypothetical protein
MEVMKQVVRAQPLLYHNAGLCLAAQGKGQEALELVEKAVELSPIVEHLVTLGNTLLHHAERCGIDCKLDISYIMPKLEARQLCYTVIAFTVSRCYSPSV